MEQFIWITLQQVLVIHDVILEMSGGNPGVRDSGLLISAINRPINAVHYGTPDIAELASLYACGIAKNHGFVDGNKRTGFIVLETFLDRNGYSLELSDAEGVIMMEQIVTGELSESDSAALLRANIRRA